MNSDEYRREHRRDIILMRQFVSNSETQIRYFDESGPSCWMWGLMEYAYAQIALGQEK